MINGASHSCLFATGTQIFRDPAGNIFIDIQFIMHAECLIMHGSSMRSIFLEDNGMRNSLRNWIYTLATDSS